MKYMICTALRGVPLLTVAFLPVLSAPFANLDFEQARPAHALPVPAGQSVFEPIDQLLPGWGLIERNLTSGTMRSEILIGLDVATDSGGYASLWSQFFRPMPFLPPFPPLEGNFSLTLAPRHPLSGFGHTEYELFQQAIMPSDAASLVLMVLGLPPKIFLDDEELSVSYTQVGTRLSPSGAEQWPLYEGWADVSEHAGQEETLRLVVRIDSPAVPTLDFSTLDSIRFSPEAVPEPGPAGLLALGGLAWLLAGWAAGRRVPREPQHHLL